MPNDARTVMDRLFGGAKSSAQTSPENVDPSTGASELQAIKRQASTARNRGKSTRSEDALKAAQLQADLDELFQQENWEVVASMYFDLRFAMTGFDYFKLTEKQEKILGSTMGSAMKVLLRIDPAYIALIIFAANFGAFAAEKELAYRHAQAVDQARRAQGENNGRQSPIARG